MGQSSRQPFNDQMKLLGRIEIVMWIGGTKHPLQGQLALDSLAEAMVTIADQMEPLNPHENGPVIKRVDRIHTRLFNTLNNTFQKRWRTKQFERGRN